MDIESLEAANQSLQADLKLAFKRIGDLQAAIEDEMESDDNEDLINRYIYKKKNQLLCLELPEVPEWGETETECKQREENPIATYLHFPKE